MKELPSSFTWANNVFLIYFFIWKNKQANILPLTLHQNKTCYEADNQYGKHRPEQIMLIKV